MKSSLFGAGTTGESPQQQEPARRGARPTGGGGARGGLRALLPLVITGIGALLFSCWHGAAATGASVFSPLPTQPSFALTNPIILVTPKALNFGTVPAGKSATNTFLVENLGPGELVGTATVPAPFKITSGERYVLKQNEIQIVTIAYTPGRALTNAATVTFTGGGSAKAMVTGKRSGGGD